MRTRAQAAAAALTLASFDVPRSMYDDIFLQVIAAFSDTEDGVPRLEEVKELACLSKALLQRAAAPPAAASRERSEPRRRAAPRSWLVARHAAVPWRADAAVPWR